MHWFDKFHKMKNVFLCKYEQLRKWKSHTKSIYLNIAHLLLLRLNNSYRIESNQMSLQIRFLCSGLSKKFSWTPNENIIYETVQKIENMTQNRFYLRMDAIPNHSASFSIFHCNRLKWMDGLQNCHCLLDFGEQVGLTYVCLTFFKHSFHSLLLLLSFQAKGLWNIKLVCYRHRKHTRIRKQVMESTNMLRILSLMLPMWQFICQLYIESEYCVCSVIFRCYSKQMNKFMQFWKKKYVVQITTME